jgi:hypothetical protein
MNHNLKELSQKIQDAVIDSPEALEEFRLKF